MKIFVTRHGQTKWNALGKIQGRKDIKLNEIKSLVERGYGDFEGITKVELKEMKKKDSRIDEACNYIKNVSIYNM